MPKICYVPKKFRAESLRLIEIANSIITDFTAQGYDLTLRQLYYQFVGRDIIPNTQKSYDNLGSLINDARLAGLVDWHSIQDRTRGLKQNSHWSGPAEGVRSLAQQFQIDKWDGQRYRPEVWVEKDALIGVIGQICRKLDVPYFSCRGYTSQSEMWVAAQRMEEYDTEGATPIVIHLGDHDPSGIDMTRDIEDRLRLFCHTDIEVRRIALNRDQVRRYRLPPNPAKLSDCRAKGYIAEHGASSWELDALNPQVISDLIEAELLDILESDKFEDRVAQEKAHVQTLLKAAKKME